MNVLFLTIADFNNINEQNIYTDLLNLFVKNNHNVVVISPIERRKKVNTHLITSQNLTILKQKIGNFQKTNIIEKGFTTLSIDYLFKNAVKKYFKNLRFDLIIYTTPPINFLSTIKYLKKSSRTFTYLLLKDIFPQNAIDIGILSKKGIKGAIYRYFRQKEINLYKVSDAIGCMSQYNIDYIRHHNSFLNNKIVELCPNSVSLKNLENVDKLEQRKSLNLPIDKKILIYGGNLGKPQGINNLIASASYFRDLKKSDYLFLVIGSGTEQSKIINYARTNSNMIYIPQLQKDIFNQYVQSSDYGMIYLDQRFTIPNFPSRLLSYMEFSLPVIVMANESTDIGLIAENNQFGFKFDADNHIELLQKLESIDQQTYNTMSRNSRVYIEQNFDVEKSYQTIMNHFKE